MPKGYNISLHCVFCYRTSVLHVEFNKYLHFTLIFLLLHFVESGVERSIIYKYIWHKFVPFQCLETSGAKKWQAITVGTDILIALSDSSGLVFYQYDGWRFSQITYSRPQPMLNQPLQSFAAVTVNTTEYIVIAPVGMLPSTSNYTVFQLEFQLANEVGSFQETLETICDENREKLESVIARIANITKEFPNLVYINSNETQVLTGNITFAENVGTADANVRGNGECPMLEKQETKPAVLAT